MYLQSLGVLILTFFGHSIAYVCMASTHMCDCHRMMLVNYATWSIRMCDIIHSCVGHVSFVWPMVLFLVWCDWCIDGTWPFHMWDMTHSCVQCETWLVYMPIMLSYVQRDSCIWGIRLTHVTCRTFLIDMRDMTCSFLWRDSLMSVAWLILVWCMTHSCLGHDSFVSVTWLIHVCVMTHPYADDGGMGNPTHNSSWT